MKKKIIRDYENYYATDDGRIFRNTGREMKLYLGGARKEYLNVRLSKNGKVKNFRVNRLIAETFVQNPDKKPFVNHKDGDKLNNRATNLEWVTAKENIDHAVKMGLIKSGEGAYNASMTDDIAHEVCKLLEDGWRNADIARKYSITTDVIVQMKRGKTWKHVTCSYNISTSEQKRISPESVKWVCSKFQEGLRPLEVLAIVKNPSITRAIIYNIYRRISYKEISKNYKW